RLRRCSVPPTLVPLRRSCSPARAAASSSPTSWCSASSHRLSQPPFFPRPTRSQTGKVRNVSMASNKTVIVTGASHGIGAAVVQAFLGRGYNVVATSRSVSKAGFAPSPNLALIDGDIGQAATAANIAQAAMSNFGSIDSLVNNTGIFLVKPFTDYGGG